MSLFWIVPGSSSWRVAIVLKLSVNDNLKSLSFKISRRLVKGYELGNNINSKILTFAFSLSAEIERNLISQRTKEALAQRRAEGKKLG
jgi:hypothetical protein